MNLPIAASSGETQSSPKPWVLPSRALDALLRLPGNAATLALLSSENLAQSEARSLSRRCESDQPALDRAFREGTRT